MGALDCRVSGSMGAVVVVAVTVLGCRCFGGVVAAVGSVVVVAVVYVA